MPHKSNNVWPYSRQTHLHEHKGICKMSNERLVDRFFAGFFAVIMLLLMWQDSRLAKWLIVGVSAVGCVSLCWVRQYLSKDGLVILAITFLGAIVLGLINLVYLS
jgi:hypothetical protein